jgi:predicted small metal-binding protein
MKIYNFICTLKGINFKYKVEAHNELEAKIKVREHIKNNVEITTIEPKETLDFLKDIFNV